MLLPQNAWGTGRSGNGHDRYVRNPNNKNKMKLHGGKINEKDDEQGSRKHEGNRGKGGNAVEG